MQIWRLLRSFGARVLAVLATLIAVYGLAAAAINRLLAAQALDVPSGGFDPTQLGLFLAFLAISKFTIFHLVSDLAARVQRAHLLDHLNGGARVHQEKLLSRPFGE